MQDNFNSHKPAKRTLLLTIDISKPFNAIPRYLLIKKYLTLNYTITLKDGWPITYQVDTHTYTTMASFQKHITFPVEYHKVSYFSPALFNLYMNDLPQPPENIHIASYADNITITSTHSNTNTCFAQVEHYMDTITTWMNTNRLKIAPTKSTATILPSHNAEHQHKPTVTPHGTTILDAHTTKILGGTFNTSRSFSQYIAEISEKYNNRLNTLRVLTGTNFEQEKETIILIYKQYTRSILSYASPAWILIASKAKVNKL
ncbi:Reverse transcriptase domain [Trinorchestia longiramus]|nr:Reverse transcriptase domain [Trinorchestia longiramus]